MLEDVALYFPLYSLEKLIEWKLWILILVLVHDSPYLSTR
ncbi:hypothetical protein C789_955 [Microcystis aeruginosa FACHB-905 = DIANCHI905]|nr:hypothetical protein C789_955 [Microcystis aeruginosa FACHB-905 = DIANCHI905]